MSVPREITIDGYTATIDLNHCVPAERENLMGLASRHTYAQQSLNAIIELLARYTRMHKQLKAKFWGQYQGDSTIVKKSKADFDQWISRQLEYQTDLETQVWLESAYETLSRIHIPRLRSLEDLAARGQGNS